MHHNFLFDLDQTLLNFHASEEKALEIGKIVAKCLNQEFSIDWDETINDQIEISPFKWDKSFNGEKEYEIEGAYETFVKKQVIK